MEDQQFIVETNPAQNHLQFLEDQINQYNIQKSGFDDYQPLAVFIRDSQNRIIAGISGYTWGGCCEIAFLWVHPDYRKMEYGRKLLKTAETEAINRNCHLVVLNSYSFQAPDFYQKLGYTISGVDEDHPIGHRSYHLQKRLDNKRETV